MELKEQIKEIESEIFSLKTEIENKHDDIDQDNDSAITSIENNKECMTVFVRHNLKRKLDSAFRRAIDHIHSADVEYKRFKDIFTIPELDKNEFILEFYKKQRQNLEDLKDLIEAEIRTITGVASFIENALIY